MVGQRKDEDSPLSPLPYCGANLHLIRQRGKPHQVRRYGGDETGEHIYSLNSLGFRGPEFDASLPHRVFAFGESHAVGRNLDFEQCWPSRFVEHWATARGLDRRDVCYQNFAESGASNGSIARAVITQCTAVRPDLVLIHFSDLPRVEGSLEHRPFQIGPWVLSKEAKRGIRRMPRGSGQRKWHEEVVARGRHFYEFATEDLFIMETLRNILLTQYYCQARGITAIATIQKADWLRSAEVQENETLGPLVAQIDPAFLCDFDIWSCGHDHATDGQHAGPSRHDGLARRMLEFLQRPSTSAWTNPHSPWQEAFRAVSQRREARHPLVQRPGS